MRIQLGDRQQRLETSRAGLRRVIRTAFRARRLGFAPPPRKDVDHGGREDEFDEISLVLVDDSTMRRLNATYRKLDRATDVLSFDLRGGPRPAPVTPLTGEIVISTDRVVRQAESYRVSIGAELARLVVHGCLHLQGFDHARPATRRVMRGAEARLLDMLEEEFDTLVGEVAMDAPSGRRRPARQGGGS